MYASARSIVVLLTTPGTTIAATVVLRERAVTGALRLKIKDCLTTIPIVVKLPSVHSVEVGMSQGECVEGVNFISLKQVS